MMMMMMRYYVKINVRVVNGWIESSVVSRVAVVKRENKQRIVFVL
jgi:hypothetical protein